MQVVLSTRKKMQVVFITRKNANCACVRVRMQVVSSMRRDASYVEYVGECMLSTRKNASYVEYEEECKLSTRKNASCVEYEEGCKGKCQFYV